MAKNGNGKNLISNNKRETVLVTGAAGTVGTYAVHHLVQAGYAVVATDRPGARFEFAPADVDRVEIREGDLTDLSFCVDAARGATAIIHLAATIDLTLPWEQMRRINVDSVRYLYEVARAQGARRFVFASSGSIYRKDRQPLTEDTLFAPQTAYERSKVAAEYYLMTRARSGTDVVILRPSMIYGPRARFLGAKLATLPPLLMLALGKVPCFEGGPLCNWVHAEDVARAAVFLLSEPRAAWDCFNVADQTPLSFGQVLQAITRAYGLPLGRSVRYPTRLLHVLGPRLADWTTLVRLCSLFDERLWQTIVAEHDLVPAIGAGIDRETFLYAGVQAVFDTRKLTALGFTVKWPGLGDGYPEVLRWFQQQRWLPSYDAAAPALATPPPPTPIIAAVPKPETQSAQLI